MRCYLRAKPPAKNPLQAVCGICPAVANRDQKRLRPPQIVGGGFAAGRCRASPTWQGGKPVSSFGPRRVGELAPLGARSLKRGFGLATGREIIR